MKYQRLAIIILSFCFVAAFSTSTTETYYLEWQSDKIKSENVIDLLLEYFTEKGLRNVTLNEEEEKEFMESDVFKIFDGPLPELEFEAGPRIWVTVFKEVENKLAIYWIWAQPGCFAAKRISGVDERMEGLPYFLNDKLDGEIFFTAGE